MSRWDLMLTSDPIPPRPDAAAAEFVEAFFQSAESALRDDSVTFPFSAIANRGMRRRLANELLLSSDGVGPGWMAMFQTAVGDLAAKMTLEAVADHPWIRAPRFDFGGDETRVPCCVLRYLCVLDIALHSLRNRAHSVFPFLVWLAIVEAHSTGPMSRVRAAWAVLDGIDRKKRLLPLLCKFLRVGKSAVQHSVSLRAIPWQLPKGWNVTRRLLRVMAAMPESMRPSAVTDQSPSALPMLYLSVVAGAAGIAVRRLFPLSFGVRTMLSAMRRLSKKDRSMCLRSEAKTLKAEGLREWRFRHQRGIAVPWQTVAPMVTPSGWHAIPIKGHKGMQEGPVVMLSLRSPARGERATLVVEDLKTYSCCTLDEEFERVGTELRVSVLGPGNSGSSYAAYHAVLEVLETFPPHELRISIDGHVRGGTGLPTPVRMAEPPESTQP